jgi:hypothetical protein
MSIGASLCTAQTGVMQFHMATSNPDARLKVVVITRKRWMLTVEV